MRAPNLRKSAPYKKMQKNVKTHTINGQTKKPPGRTTAIPRKNLRGFDTQLASRVARYRHLQGFGHPASQSCSELQAFTGILTPSQ